ncbi:L-rhamnose mutarotase [Streptomyces sp. NPDC091377]|uniref:L-rhamnose mutarotase n=1 Tax=Streptomyces sp. NPDC091377 TaxID=3365995 RepID=UPI003807A5F5
MKRIAQTIRLRPEHRDEYLRLHAAVWPTVEDALRAANIRNYSIHLLGDTLFGYYEYHGTDHAADLATIAADPQTQAWWALTAPCQERLPGTPEERQWTDLQEVWHLD